MAVSARGPKDAPSSAKRGRHARVRESRSKRHPIWRAIRELVIVVVLALAIAALVRAFVVQAFYVPSSSMEMTLQPSDRILAMKPRIGSVQRGEVVVFKDPANWLPEPLPQEGWRGELIQALTFIGILPSDSGKDLVKRVIGISGDRIACCDADGHIVVNGIPLLEDYIIGPTDQVRFDVVVPDDSVFVMGDNRGDSRDSRFFLDEASGSVPIENIVGRASVIVWPVNRAAVLDIPQIFGVLTGE
jgi:signal peptidase I